MPRDDKYTFQKTKSIKGHTNYGKHMEKVSDESGDDREEVAANPDVLPESAVHYAVDEATKEVSGRVQKLVGLAKQILTDQQYKVFSYMALREPALTERETARRLGISHQRVHELWEVARQKLQKAYEDRT